MTEPKKPSISFGFSKMKPKTNVVKIESSLFKDEFKKKEDEVVKIELITSLSDKKVNPADNSKNEENKPLVIPCQRNRDILGAHLKEKQSLAKNDHKVSTNSLNADDLDAVKALREEANKAKEESKDDGLVIKTDVKEETSALESVDDADYEAIDIEKFGNSKRLFIIDN
jgi:hypothetical protein